MDYLKLVEFFNSVDQFGINPGLTRIQLLLEKLGDPQKFLPVIHLTGTNGKTSTARIISSILTEHGLKTGTYTSPHLCSYTERFSVDGAVIPEEKLVEIFEKMLPSLRVVEKEVLPDKFSLFEILTALAFLYFWESKVDALVMEVGMGGRWDATNVVSSRVSVVTNVSLDHTDRLGKTVAEIAWEKAHIIKRGCAAIGGNLERDSLRVVEERCLSEGVDLKLLGRDFALSERKKIDSGQIISVKGLYGEYENLGMHLLGEHQAINATLACVSSEAFLKERLKKKRLKDGLRKTKSPGRLEIIKEAPLVILDGAHNPDGAFQLAKALKSEFTYRNLIFIISILSDKDIEGILKELLPLSSLIIFTENQSYRSAKASLLAEQASNIASCKVVVEPCLAKAIKEALKKANLSDLVCITGSLYTVGDARAYFFNRNNLC